MERPRLYCGNQEVLPPGYDGFGTRYSCLRSGVGVGLYKLADQARRIAAAEPRQPVPELPLPIPRRKRRTWLYVLIISGVLILLAILGLVIYLIVKKKKRDDEKKKNQS
jgi:hypothetical protein